MAVFNRQQLIQGYCLILAVAVGMLAALGAVLFRSLIELFQHLFWSGDGNFLAAVAAAPWWLVLLIPTGAGLVAGPVLFFWAPQARGPGVSEVIAAVVSIKAPIRYRVSVIKGLVTSLLIGAGASLGREGPIVHIGASVGAFMAQTFKIPSDFKRMFLAAGAAAGISATFNAPMAGTLFAVEVILLDLRVAHISYIIVASVSGSALARFFWGDFPALDAFPFHFYDHLELGLYLGLGIAAGICSIGFVRGLYATEGLFHKLPLPGWLLPAVGGLMVGAMGIFIPHILGVGYGSVNLALAGKVGLGLALTLLAAKMLATAICLGSGMSGGILAPSLYLGAMLGTVTGLLVNTLFPSLDLNPAYYALAGMGAFVAGTTLAPMTAIITVFELTYNHQVILPLMAACISSSLVVRVFFGYSAYELKNLRQGLNIVRGHDVSILRGLKVNNLMTRDFETLPATLPLLQIVDRIIHSNYPHFVVDNAAGELVGILSPHDVKPTLNKLADLKDVVIAADLMTTRVVSLAPDDNLEKAFVLFSNHHVSFMPVMDKKRPGQVLGVLKETDLLAAYEQKVLKKQMLSSS